jgi:RNA polymerase sigma-70 factor (ECF subfamily)
MNLPQQSLTNAPTLESLLAHADWVRSLAGQLVRDPGAADDLEQEVWLEAMQRPPAHGANPRGWLAAVARNAARQLKRGDARRSHREHSAARPEALPSTTQLVEEASLSRELADLVLQLDEPYRTTLLLRYFRALSIDDIAKAQSLPRETVRTRQRRGLELLRERLDATRGGRANWVAAFAPLAYPQSAPLAASSGVAVGLWILAALVALLVGGLWFAQTRESDEFAQAVAPTPVNSSEVRAADVAAPANSASSRAEIASSAAPLALRDESPSTPSTARNTVAGRLIDPKGNPLVDMVVLARPKYGARIENGEVVIPTAPHIADGTPVHELRGPATGVIYSGEARVPITPEDQALYAHVPLALETELKRHKHAPGLREALLGLPAPRNEARTGANGAFELEIAFSPSDIDLSDERWVIVKDFGSREAGTWTLVAAPTVRVAGVVVDEEGAPITPAQVQHWSSDDALRELDLERASDDASFASRVVQVDELGRFAFERLPRLTKDTLIASADGYESASLESPLIDTLDLRIVLKRRAPESDKPALRGIVLHADGSPAAGAGVYLGQDQTQSGDDGRFELRLSCCHDGKPLVALLPGAQPALIADFGKSKTPAQENIVLRLGAPTLAIRGRVVDAKGKPIARAHVQLFDGTAFSNMQCYAEDANEGRRRVGVLTNAGGEFELGGLSERAYRLLAWWDDKQVVISDPIPAGSTDVALSFDASRNHEKLRGRVVTRAGEPLAKVRVNAKVDSFRSKGWTIQHVFGAVTTDAEGEFTLLNVPREFAKLGVSGMGIDTQSFELPADSAAELTLVAALRVRVELEVADERVDRVHFLDAQGATVTVNVRRPGVISASDAVAREKGSFPEFDLLDSAVTAVLSAEGSELARAEVRFERTPKLRLRL